MNRKKMNEEKKAFEFDESLAGQLHLLFATPSLKKLRKEYFDFFAVKPGERVLDIGCGSGANAIALAERLAGEVHVTGIDSSEPMLAIGSQDLKNHACNKQIDLQYGDANHLPFSENTFDSAMMIQVLEYAKDGVAMLAEARRVLKPGGRLFVADTDWDTVVWNSNQKERTRRIVHAWADHEADGWQGRKILELLKRAGYQLIQGRIYTIEETSFHETEYPYLMTQIVVDYLLRSEKMAPAEINDWVDDLKAKDQAGYFYFSLNRYVYVAYK
jgi:arsenite methyltransferase